MTTSQRRKLTIDDAKAIALLIVKQKSTETDACITLDIRPDQWFSWKSKNKRSEQFSSLITRIKERKLEGIISKIEDAGDDYEMVLPNGKVITKRGDWRAGAWLAERWAPERFAQQQSSQPPQPVINIGIMADTLKRIFTNEPMKVISNSPNGPQTLPDDRSEVLTISEGQDSGEQIKTPYKSTTAIKLPIRRTRRTNQAS